MGWENIFFSYCCVVHNKNCMCMFDPHDVCIKSTNFNHHQQTHTRIKKTQNTPKKAERNNWKNFNTFLQYFACDGDFYFLHAKWYFSFFSPLLPAIQSQYEKKREQWAELPVHKFTTIEKTPPLHTCFINLLPIYQIFIKLKSSLS